MNYGFLHYIRFFFMSLTHSLAIFSVVVTNGFLEDIILVLDILYPVCHKTKVIYRKIQLVYIIFPQQSTTRNKIPVMQSFSF